VSRAAGQISRSFVYVNRLGRGPMLSRETRTTPSASVKHRTVEVTATWVAGTIVSARWLGPAVSARSVEPPHAVVVAIVHARSAARVSCAKPPPAGEVADGGFD
jgi:hypothetical protein